MHPSARLNTLCFVGCEWENLFLMPLPEECDIPRITQITPGEGSENRPCFMRWQAAISTLAPDCHINWPRLTNFVLQHLLRWIRPKIEHQFNSCPSCWSLRESLSCHPGLHPHGDLEGRWAGKVIFNVGRAQGKVFHVEHRDVPAHGAIQSFSKRSRAKRSERDPGNPDHLPTTISRMATFNIRAAVVCAIIAATSPCRQ